MRIVNGRGKGAAAAEIAAEGTLPYFFSDRPLAPHRRTCRAERRPFCPRPAPIRAFPESRGRGKVNFLLYQILRRIANGLTKQAGFPAKLTGRRGSRPFRGRTAPRAAGRTGKRNALLQGRRGSCRKPAAADGRRFSGGGVAPFWIDTI